MFALPLTRRRVAGFVLLLGFASLMSIALSPAQSVTAQTSSILGTAESYAVLAYSTITNVPSGTTLISGNLGLHPNNAITGFPPGVVTGETHLGDAPALQAKNDAGSAYTTLAGLPCGQSLVTELGGSTLTPGVYCLATAGINGQLKLNAQNNPNASFVFQVGSTLITGSSSSVLVINSGPTCNVFWQVGSSATLGSATQFVGNILASANISLGTGANIFGRAFAGTEAVNLDDNDINPNDCRRTQLTLTKDDGGGSVAPGGTINYTLNYQNAGTESLSDVILTETVPGGTAFNGAGGWVCVSDTCTLNVGTLAANASGSATFSVTLLPGTTGEISNTASVASGTTISLPASDTTPVTVPDDDDDDDEDDDDDNPTSPPPAATAPPPAATAGPGPVPTIPGVVGTVVPIGVNPLGTPIFTVNGTPVVLINGTPIVLVNGTPVGPLNTGVFGLPNTGGAEPQATYWLTLTPGR